MTGIRNYLKSRVARRLDSAIILTSSFITLATTAIQLYFDYKNDLDQIDLFFSQMKKSYLPIVTNSLWDFDDQQVETELSGILALPGVKLVEVVHDNRVTHSHGHKKSKHFVEHSFPLVVEEPDRTVHLGQLMIYYSLDFTYNQLYRKAFSILLSNMLLTFSVSVFILVLVHRLVTNRLFSIASRIRTIDMHGQNNSRVDSYTDQPNGGKGDEFEEILDAVTFMQSNLNKAFEDLSNSQERYFRLFEQSPVPLWEEDFSDIVKELRENNIFNAEQCRLYLEQHPFKIINFAQKVKIIDVNNAALKLHNAESKDELMGNLDKIFTNQSLKTFKEELVALASGIKEFKAEGEVSSLDGRTKFISVNVSFNSDENDNNIAMLATEDITQRVEKERENDLLISALKNVAESVIITDSRGDIIYVNPAFEDISGFNYSEVLGKNPRFLSSGMHNLSFYASMWDTLLAGDIWREKICNKKKNGTLYYEDVSISPVTSTDGTTTSYVSVKRDITEERETRKKLLQTQKMESIGNLAGGIAHDFNNILSSILGFSEIILDEIDDNSPIHKDINEVIHAAIRAKDLVNQILLFARKSDEEIKPVHVGLVISEVASFLESTIPTTITIEKNIESDAHILGNVTHLHQVLMNFCTNGVHAIGEEFGKINISSFDLSLDENEVNGLKAGKYVKISVSDSGKGIPPEDFEVVFEPYYSTKGPGGGTGLGLAVVQGIISNYGGEITLESEISKGTTFTLYLPSVEALKEKCDTGIRLPTQGNERILFVDDETAIASMGERLLSRLGYTVTVCTSSTKALELISSDPSRFDLLISDMTMPNMTGDELAAKCMEIKPDLPVILCTGYSSRLSQEAAIAADIRAFVFKPITKDEFAVTIRNVLDE